MSGSAIGAASAVIRLGASHVLAAKVALACVAIAAVSARAQAQAALSSSMSLKAADVFALAEQADARGNLVLAENAYRALIKDDDEDLRNEARFRLARMLANKLNRHREAAVLLRRILDDKPDAGPVRLELAKLLAMMGEEASARRELRAVLAGDLPADVEQQIRFFANALTARKRVGASLEVALAPNTNINRATRSDTLGTVIGDFALSDDAQARSGVGLSLKGQAYLRTPLGRTTDLLTRVNAAGDLYRAASFNDTVLSVQSGPQWFSGADRLTLGIAVRWRWYGQKPYTRAHGVTANWQHPLGKRAQLRMDVSAMDEDNRANDAQDAKRYALAVGVDHAFSIKAGGGVQIHGTREAANEPGYSSVSGGLGFYVYREFGRTTAVLNAAYSRLEADERLALFPRRRVDDSLSVGVSASFRQLSVGTFAPVVRLRYDRNWSSVELYAFSRFGAEVGITAAF